MSTEVNLIDRLQNDIVGRIQSDEFFEDILIIQERLAESDTQIQKAAAGELAKREKFGAFLIVELPSMEPEDFDTPGPRLKFSVAVHARVIPDINNSKRGTQKPLGMIARRINALFHLWLLDTSAVTVAGVDPYSDKEGVIGFTHVLEWHGGEDALASCASVAVSIAALSVTLTCATSGSRIFYTLDDSLPWPGNPNAIHYSAPFTVEDGDAIRAAAYAPDKIGSFIIRTIAES